MSKRAGLDGLSDPQLESALRQEVHMVEKWILEQSLDAERLERALRLYREALRRDLLGEEEIAWCQRVLLGRKPPADYPSQQTAGGARVASDTLIQALATRRSVRQWKPVPLSLEDYRRLVESARWAPSSCNRQPCYFLLTRDQEKIALLSRVRGQKFLSRAPSCIIVLANMRAYDSVEVAYTPYLDAGAAIQNVLLAAHGLGLGACWVNFGTKGISPESRQEIHATFGIPSDYKIVSLVAVGVAARLPNPPGRKSLSATAAVESFGRSFSPGET
jgi:nitroreductase